MNFTVNYKLEQAGQGIKAPGSAISRYFLPASCREADVRCRYRKPRCGN